MRLIDADALKEAMNYNGACGICFRYVDDADTIDAAPVRHGRWLDICKTDARLRECSVCHNWQVHYEKYIPKYCPECGAKMDGDGNATN